MGSYIKKKISEFMDDKIRSNRAYHITSKSNLTTIFRNGLSFDNPEDYCINGNKNGVFLFKTIDRAKFALSKWLGENIDDIENNQSHNYDEVCVEIDITELHDSIINCTLYDFVCTVDITPDKITKVIVL